MSSFRYAVLVAVSGLAAVTTSAQCKPVNSPYVPQGYSLVWNDEFEGSGLPNFRKWNFDTIANTYDVANGELQYYAAERKENIFVKDGNLNIVARKEDMVGYPNYQGQHYSSARIQTRDLAKWTYGYFEVRAKIPCGAGTWPAIWTLGANGRWPTFGEIDIMEHVARTPDQVYGTIHNAFSPKGIGSKTRVADVCDSFHVYQMTWTKDKIDIAVDGTVYDTYTNNHTDHNQWPFDEPEYFVLNLTMGGAWGGPVDDSALPQALVIDYVRVYQKK